MKAERASAECHADSLRRVRGTEQIERADVLARTQADRVGVRHWDWLYQLRRAVWAAARGRSMRSCAAAPASIFLPRRCSRHASLQSHDNALMPQSSTKRGKVPMRSTLNPALSRFDLALSEFAKARWADEPSFDAHLQPTDLDLVASTPSSFGKQAWFAVARFLIAFCSGVAATLAWQSYGDAARTMIASSSPQLDLSVPQAAPEAATRTMDVGGFGFVVQLSAHRSEPGAQAAFRTMQAKYSVLSGRQPLIRRKDQGERGIFYAAQVGPFDMKSDADQLCETLRSAGGTCFVGKN